MKKTAVLKKQTPPKEKKEPKGRIKASAAPFTKNYTNERIRSQIEENSVLFKVIVCLLLFAFFLIALSFVMAYKRYTHGSVGIPVIK